MDQSEEEELDWEIVERDAATRIKEAENARIQRQLESKRQPALPLNGATPSANGFYESTNQIVERIAALWRKHPGNLSLIAKETGLTRAEVSRLVEKHKSYIQEAEDELLDSIEEKVYLAAKGELEEKNFDFGRALKVLQLKRPGWGKVVENKNSGRQQPGSPDENLDKMIEDIKSKAHGRVDPKTGIPVILVDE